MKYLIKPIINHPYLTICLIFLVSIFLGYEIRNLKVDTDLTKMIPEDHPTRIAEDAMKEAFGITEMILVGLVTDNIFNADFLAKIKSISKKLKRIRIDSDPFLDSDTGEIRTKKRRCIEDVISLSTINYIEGTEEGMEVSDLMEKVPENPEGMNRLREKITSWDFYLGNLVSADFKATSIAVEYKAGLSFDEVSRVVEALRSTIEQEEFGETVQIYVAGSPVVSAAIADDMMNDFLLMLPAVFVIVLLFLLFAMRSISNVLMIFITIVVSVLWTMGLITLFGFSLQMMTSTIPVTLVAIGSAYSIHIVNHYSDERADGRDAAEAVENTISIVGQGVLAAALTTMAGFLSLMASSLTTVKEFGLFMGLGTGVAFIVSVVLVPAILLVFDRISNRITEKTKPAGFKSGIDLVPLLQNIAEKLTRKKKMVFVTTVLLIGTAAFFSAQVRTGFNAITMFKKDSEVRKADAFLCEKFSGTTTTVIVLEADEDDYFKQPDILRKLDALKAYMEEDPEVGMVATIAEPIKRMNYAMNENKEEYNSIPETRQHVAQYLLLNSDPEDLESLVTSDYRKARIVALLKDGSSDNLKRVKKKMSAWLDREISGLKISFTGRSQMSLVVNNLIIMGQVKSLILSTVMVFVIASIILRSALGGLFAIIPLAISVLMNFGILGSTGLPLDSGAAMVSAIAIGIGVDYSIHLLSSVKHGFMTKGAEYAVNEGIKITGNAIMFNAVSVACGFLVMVFSSFNEVIKMGSFIAFTMFTSSAGTMLLLPVLINTISPKFLKRNGHPRHSDREEERVGNTKNAGTRPKM